MVSPKTKIAAAAIIFAALSGRELQAKTIAPPQNEAEVRAMMKITVDQHVLPPGAKAETLEQLLEIGEVILYYDHPRSIPWMSAAGILINAPVEDVYKVVLDHPNYPKFMPMTAGISSKKLFDGLYQEKLSVEVKFSFLKYRLDYGLYSYRRPPTRLDWSLAWGDFDINIGFWELIPTPDRKRTMAFYSIYSTPSGAFMKKIYAGNPWMEMMTNVSAATMICQTIRKETEKRQGFSRPPASGQPMVGVQKILDSDPQTLLLFLERGNMIILAEGPTVYSVVGSMVKAPAQEVYSVITDFKSYPQFVPGVKKVEPVPPAVDHLYKWELKSAIAFLEYEQTQQWYYEFSPPSFVWWEVSRPCCGPAACFWKIITLEDKTIFFNGSTADIRSMGAIPKYALGVEPTMEHAVLTSQALLLINAVKKRIEQGRGRY